MIKSKKSLRPIWKKSRALSLYLKEMWFRKSFKIFMNRVKKDYLIKELQQKTGMGILDCFRCLQENNWDVDKAFKNRHKHDTSLSKPLITYKQVDELTGITPEMLDAATPKITNDLNIQIHGTPGEPIVFNEETLRDAIQSIVDSSGIEDIGYVGGGMYYLGGGIYTGELGWKNFNEALYKAVHKFGGDNEKQD